MSAEPTGATTGPGGSSAGETGCPSCGAPMAPSGLFCPRCGRERGLPPAPSPPGTVTWDEGGTLDRLALVFALVGPLALLGAVLLALL